MNAPALMTPAQMESYTAFLTRLARAARGRLREFLEAAISDLNPWGFL